ncbi:MAG: NADH pyrophosphatase, partial [Rhodoglobus sp.]
MSHSFLGNLPLSRLEVDRDHAARENPDLLDELWANPATRILPIFQGSALLAGPTTLALLPVDAVPHGEQRVYLGRSISQTSPEPAGTPIVAVELVDAGHLA